VSLVSYNNLFPVCAGRFFNACGYYKRATSQKRDKANTDKKLEKSFRIRAEIGFHDSAQRFRELGIDLYFGEGQFMRANTFEVDSGRNYGKGKP